MRIQSLATLALFSLAAAAPSAEPAPEAGRVSPAAYCEWNGYDQTYFHGSYIKSGGTCGACHQITNPKLINQLYSAIVTYGSRITLYTSGSCSGSSQVIDANGYRDMTNLPAYHSWK